MEKKPVNHIIIVGGGTAGWMTAASLSRHFRRTSIAITLIESSEIGTVGVGEATIPTLRRFYGELGMNDLEVMRATRATCKLGIQFRDWRHAGSRFIHPFGLFGQSANGIPFHHYWMKLRHQGADAGELPEYSLGVQLAEHHKFVEPSPNPPSELSVFDWALHFDAAKFAELMRSHAEKHGVTRIDARITSVRQNADDSIASLHLDNGREISGDLFIDCSGFRALLIEQTLHTGYEDWSEWLLCDSAVAVQSELVGDPPPYTISQAHGAGWQWRIPLQHRQGNGHVYCSRYISEDEAIAILKKNIDGQLLHEPRKFNFTPGRRRQAWNKNCIAVGLASGFLEPLESTSIALVETAIEKIRHSFLRPYFTQAEVDQFNELTAQEYDRVRDFIILHYALNQRIGESFWDECRAVVIPQTLQKKVEAFTSKGDLIRYPIEIFGAPSWLAIYHGFGVLPQTYDLRVEQLNEDYLKQSLAEMRKSIRHAVDSVMTHQEFIKTHCAVSQ